MAGDYGSGQGGKQSISSTEASPKESGTPKTGFSSSGKCEKPGFGPGPGVPGNNRKIK
jgi:hypothetical protein